MATALVTGASAGLGTVFARQMAARGDDLILTARRADRLEALAVELRAAHGVQVDVIGLDLGAADGPAALMQEVGRRGLAVNTLVNNAGFGLRGALADHDPDQLAQMIDLNCRSLMLLSRLVLPGMIQMRAGGILNVASTAAFQPGPWMAVYYATKAFVLSFSEALHEEVKAKGVRVVALCPGATRTEFADVAGMADTPLFKRFAGDADAVVRDGLAALDANRAVAVSGTLNKLMAGSVRFGTRGMVRRMAAGMQRARGE